MKTAKIYNEQQRQPRRHKCEIGNGVFKCGICTNMMENSIYRIQDFHGRQDVALYDSKHSPSGNRSPFKAIFVCENHEKNSKTKECSHY